MNCNHKLDRKELIFPDGDDGRVYYCDICDIVVPSVTTITGRRDDPSKEYALKGWRKSNNGKNGNADHKLLLPYTQWRGTLTHFNILYRLDPSLSSSPEERSSLDSIKKHSTDYKWVHSVLKNRSKYRHTQTQSEFDAEFPHENEYDGRSDPTLRNILAEDAGWATRQFYNMADELGLADVSFEDSDCVFLGEYVDDHIRTENVIHVEHYIPTTHGYSGQLDLLYERPDGSIVLCDIKTSSRTRWSHKCQSAAYANALARDVDDMVIARIHPDSRESELKWEADFGTSRETYMKEFNSLKNHVLQLVRDMDVLDSDSNENSTQEASA